MQTLSPPQTARSATCLSRAEILSLAQLDEVVALAETWHVRHRRRDPVAKLG